MTTNPKSLIDRRRGHMTPEETTNARVVYILGGALFLLIVSMDYFVFMIISRLGKIPDGQFAALLTIFSFFTHSITAIISGKLGFLSRKSGPATNIQAGEVGEVNQDNIGPPAAPESHSPATPPLYPTDSPRAG